MTAPVRVHIRVPGTAPMPDLMRLIRSIEAAGFDGAGILDSQLISRDTFVTLGQAATHTTRLTLFPAVTNPFTRHASVLAGAIQTVEELAPGRVKFVIGTGYTSASTIGRKAATLGEMRECVATVKTLLAGESARFGETAGRLGYAAGRPIPVLMAASGPKAIELAGEIADGALLLVGFNRGIVQRALEHLERGARRAGRKLEDLEIIWAVRTASFPTTAEALRQARPTSVHWGILRWGGYWLEPAGLRLPPLEIPDAVWKIYPDLSHAHDWEAAIAATSFVPDEVVAQLCEAMGLIGTPADAAARIAEMTRLGVRNLYLMPLLTFAPPEAEIAAFRDTVFPRLATAGLR
ncbi:MAG TPA: LLM class flavin-dependent oxidoreductase [Candidatus Dormibacteraeota bacterium]|jgi:5,10-methylenetetrahydromethanopterin reductase|nr:LLM class flavin-dependent oxidoreductase [Candidatus Dormibacteraeota bacterium]